MRRALDNTRVTRRFFVGELFITNKPRMAKVGAACEVQNIHGENFGSSLLLCCTFFDNNGFSEGVFGKKVQAKGAIFLIFLIWWSIVWKILVFLPLRKIMVVLLYYLRLFGTFKSRECQPSSRKFLVKRRNVVFNVNQKCDKVKYYNSRAFWKI